MTGAKRMIKQIAWNTFKNTGDINTFLEFKSISEAEIFVESSKLVTEVEHKEDARVIENIRNNRGERT